MIEDLIEYCEKNLLNYQVISYAEKEKIKSTINDYFIDKSKKNGRTLFDFLKISESVSVNDPDSWRLLKPFFVNKKAVVFFRYDDEKYVMLSDSSLFFDFYDNYPAIEFYLIETSGESLCGYNHSHVVFAMGKAADWLEQSEKYMEYYK
jgi:hypothetical protein